ncbi:MAG: HIT family protein [Rhodocyclaceae bacterium]|nr:HIT family protein [Rhodocyclaceae bacterium]MBX3669639.1 HIT family protein [Rhodocyclaceae bacterium]
MSGNDHCQLCCEAGGAVLWQDGLCRIVLAQDGEVPGILRVIWRAHVAEMTDLTRPERQHFMDSVYAAEAALRAGCAPDKINLASLGNMVPHLHWHVIPRWRDDAFFPRPIWGAPQRAGAVREVDVARIARALQQNLYAEHGEQA